MQVREHIGGRVYAGGKTGGGLMQMKRKRQGEGLISRWGKKAEAGELMQMKDRGR